MSAGDKLRIGVLGSGAGTNLDVIFRAIHDRMLPAEIKVVVSDVREAGLLHIGRAHRVVPRHHHAQLRRRRRDRVPDLGGGKKKC